MKKLDVNLFDAVAFDVEGVLANTIPTHHDSRQDAFRQYGYSHITREEHELGPTYGSSHADIVGGILHAAGVIDKAVPFSENPHVQAVVETHKAMFSALAAKGFDEMPGASDFVKAIAAFLAGHLALVTSSAEEFVLPFIERYQLTDYFPPNCIIGADATAAAGLQGKPSGDPYLLAMQRLHANKLLVFEDTVSGVASAKRAGATVIALGFDAGNAKLFESGDLEFPPDIFVHNYDEAKAALGLTQ